MSMYRWMDKKDVITNGILLNHIKEWKEMLFAATWMEIEIIVLDEVSQKKKNKYYMINHNGKVWRISYICMTVSLCCEQKLIQHCKSTIFQ